MKKRDSTRSNASLSTLALFIIQLPGSHEQHAQMGVTFVTKFGRTLGATVMIFCQLCTNPSGYNLGRHTTPLELNIQDSKAEELFEIQP